MDLPPEGTASTGSDEFDRERRALLEAAAPPELVPFVREMNARGYAVPSVAHAVFVAREFLGGPVSGYRMARLLDTSKSPEEANANRATAAALEIMEILGADAFGYDKTFPVSGSARI